MRNRASHGFPRRKLRLCAFFFSSFFFSLLSSSLFFSVLLSICSLFTDPNPDDPLVPEIAQLLKKGASARGGCAIDGASDCSVTTRRTQPAARSCSCSDRALTSRPPCPRIAIVIAFIFLLAPFCFSLAAPQTARRTTSTPPSGRESTRRPKRKGNRAEAEPQSQCRPPATGPPSARRPSSNQFNICALPTDATDRCSLPDRAAAVLIPWPVVTPQPGRHWLADLRAFSCPFVPASLKALFQFIQQQRIC